MINAKIQEVLSLLVSIQYTHTKNIGFDFSNRPSPCHNFVFMLEGEGTIESKDETFHLKSGDILFIPKNTTYKSEWFPNPKAVFHSLHFNFLAKNDPLLNKNIPVQLLDNTQFEQLYALLKRIEITQYSKNTDSFFALSAFYELCGSLLNGIKIDKSTSTNKTILPAIFYIEQNYTRSFTVERLANLCYLSPSRFYYLFKQQTGISPIVYKNKIAIQNSLYDLLYNNELSIKQVSEKHGFSNINYFERLFKQFIGNTPSNYRKEENSL